MSAQVGKDHTIPRNQRLGSRVPEFMTYRKGMQQDNRRAGSDYFVEDFSIPAADLRHRTIKAQDITAREHRAE